MLCSSIEADILPIAILSWQNMAALQQPLHIIINDDNNIEH